MGGGGQDTNKREDKTTNDDTVPIENEVNDQNDEEHRSDASSINAIHHVSSSEQSGDEEI